MLGQNEGQQEEGRLAAAAALLDRNAVAVFKLAGLAKLRQQAASGSGGTGTHTPSDDELRLLEQAQAALQEVAALLPPKILMPQATVQRLRQQLQSQAAAAAATASGDAPEAAGASQGRKRKLAIKKGGEVDERQRMMDQLQSHEEQHRVLQEEDHRQERMAELQELLQAQHPAAAKQAQPAAAAAAPQQQEQRQRQWSSQLLPAGASLQGGLTGILGAGALGSPMPSAHGAPGAAAAAAATAQQQLEQQAQAQAAGQAPPMLAEPMSKEDMFLLSQAYSSMTAEQKEKLAAQPPEVRQFVLRERMRKTREQLKLLQAQRAAAAAAAATVGLAAAPGAAPGLAAQPGQEVVWGGGGLGSGLGGGLLSSGMVLQQPPSQQQQQQAQLGGLVPQLGPLGMQQQPDYGQQLGAQPTSDWLQAPGQVGSPQLSAGLAGLPPQLQTQILQQQQQQQQQVGGGALFDLSMGMGAPQADPLQQQQLPSMRLPSLDFAALGSAGLQQQQQQALQQRLGANGGMALQSQQLPAGLAGPSRGISPPTLGGVPQGVPQGAAGPQPSAPFAAMSEAERLERLRQLKQRQDQWLEQQRVAASMLE